MLVRWMFDIGEWIMGVCVVGVDLERLQRLEKKKISIYEERCIVKLVREKN